MIKLLLLCLGCVAATALYAQDSSPEAYTGPKEKLHVYLLIGQSNMAGRAPFTEEDSGVIDRCYLLNDKDKWEAAKNPLNRYSTVRKGLGMQKMNPGFTFSKMMLEKNKDISLGLVVNAKGGTKIEQWQKGTVFYNEAVRRTQEAQKTGVLMGILWHQGESNSEDSEAYLEKLADLVVNLRKDLGNPNLPFVAGQVFYDPDKRPKTKQINEQLAKLPDILPGTGCVSSDNLTTLDNTHFDTEGMKQLGKRYAEAMLEIQAKMATQ